MSGLFGGGATQSELPTRYNGIQIASSTSGGCLPLLYGQMRIPFNLIWYGAFTSTATKSSGGKGGGGSQTTGFTYTASFAAALCEGPITAIQQTWRDKDLTTLAAQGMTLFSGAGGQAAWSYLATNFAAQAVPYDHTCYVGAQNYALGNSAAMPNITFEVAGLLYGNSGTAITFTAAPAAGATSATLTSAVLATGLWTITFSNYEVRMAQVTGTAVQWQGGLNNAGQTLITTAALGGGPQYDSDPALFIPDYLSDPNHGAGFPSGSIATLTGANSFQSYCKALGLFLSPCETTQRAAADFINEIAQITNSAPLWSAGLLKMIPYADVAVSGNGATYTPNLTPQFNFTDDDFLEPPILTRKAIADTFNHVRIEYLDRSNQYNTAIAEASDINDIALNGERVMDTLNFHEITNSTTAGLVAQLILQMNLYERNTLKFKTRADYSQLEPMDYVGIIDAKLGFGGTIFRITKVTDTERHELEFEAMQILGTVRNTPFNNWASVQGYNANFNIAPGSVQAPAFFEAYGAIVGPNGGRELWVAVGGPSASPSWGGCQAFISFDNVNYFEFATLTNASRYGVTGSLSLVADPDTTSTLDVVLNNNQDVLGSNTNAQADANQSLIAIGNGATTEVCSYGPSTLVTAGEYHLTYLRRGQYGTHPQSHSASSQFIRLDDDLIKMNLDAGYMGTQIWFKFCSFNIYGRAIEDISTVTAYSYTPGQALSAFNTVTEATFSAAGQAVLFSPNSGFKQTTASAAWDSSIYSSQSFANGCSAECYSSQPSSFSISRFMMGLTTNPAANLTGPNNYANLNYAFAVEASSGIQIYESGTLIGTFAASYTSSTLLQILYDGKHIQYYIAGVLVRSVAIANQTFFLQCCLFDPGASLYGLDFSGSTQVATPFTLVPMSLNVAAAGNSARTVGTTTANTWGLRNFKSAESYSDGAQISFSYPTQGNDAMIGLSTAPATGGSTQGQNFFASFYLDAFHGDVFGYFGTAQVLGITHSIVTSDVFTITYDNFTVRWWLNGALLNQQYFPGAAPLFLFGDFLNDSLLVQNISFGPYGQLSPNPFVAYGTAVTHDSTANKPTGSAAWDSGIYSANAYTICHLQAKTNTTADVEMIGLTTNPIASPSYTNLNYAWYNGAGTWQIFESGTLIGSIATVAATDLVAITYDGSNVRYYLNAVIQRTVAIASQTFYLQSSIEAVGSGWNSLSFGPGTVLDLVPTASIDDNAVSQTITFTGASLSVGTSVASPASATTNIITIVTQGGEVGIDLSAMLRVNASGGTPTLTDAKVEILRDGSVLPGGAGQYDDVSGVQYNDFRQFGMLAFDNPAAGSHTYAIRVTVAGTIGTLSHVQMLLGNNTGSAPVVVKVREYKK